MSPPDISAQGTVCSVAADIIRAKCDGTSAPSAAQIDWIIAAYTAAEIDEQMAALAMAVLLAD